jgi:hypothetical protein
MPSSVTNDQLSAIAIAIVGAQPGVTPQALVSLLEAEYGASTSAANTTLLTLIRDGRLKVTTLGRLELPTKSWPCGSRLIGSRSVSPWPAIACTLFGVVLVGVGLLLLPWFEVDRVEETPFGREVIHMFIKLDLDPTTLAMIGGSAVAVLTFLGLRVGVPRRLAGLILLVGGVALEFLTVYNVVDARHTTSRLVGTKIVHPIEVSVGCPVTAFGAALLVVAGIALMIERRSSGHPPAGWYPDPNRPGTLAYWDGGAWELHG